MASQQHDYVVYGAPLSPFVRKVEVFLREKGIEYELDPVNIMPVPEGFEKISPARRIPAFRDRSQGEDATLADSSVICAYLERRNPEPPLYPSDDFAYARALWFEEYSDSELAGRIGMGVFRPIVFPRFQGKEPDLETARKAVGKQLPRLYDYLEAEIDGRDFFVGDSITVADIAIASQFVSLDLAVGLPDASRWPALVAFVNRMLARESFATTRAIGRKIIKEPVDLGL